MIKKNMQELERISKDTFKQAEKIPITIVLDEVRSMHNVGSVFRTADCFLLEAIYLCGVTPQPPHRDIQKTALGATETVTWKYVNQTINAIDELLLQQYTIIAIEQVHNSISLEKFALDKTKKYALIFGNEVNGVAQDVLQKCHHAIEIPQIGSKHSLNISVSAGIVIWELAKKYF